jgi:hypothetical protein
VKDPKRDARLGLQGDLNGWPNQKYSSFTTRDDPRLTDKPNSKRNIRKLSMFFSGSNHFNFAAIYYVKSGCHKSNQLQDATAYLYENKIILSNDQFTENNPARAGTFTRKSLKLADFCRNRIY